MTSRLLLLVFLGALTPALGRAQEPAAVRKVVLPSLDTQVRARLMALDGRLNPVHTPELAAGLVGHLTAPAAVSAFAPILGNARNLEVWEQMPDDLYRMMLESGDALVTLAESLPPSVSGWSSGQVRRLCHERLAALPRTSLGLYRQQVDAEAKALLAQGRRTRAAAPLRRLVDDYFCSRYGDEALDLLGDLAFERGHFDEARHWWGLLVPLTSARGERFCFPDPQVDLVRVRAKQVLAMIFQGRLNDARADIAAFQQRFPDERGWLAGQDGIYHRTLDKTLAGFARERIANNAEPWSTFGGDAARNRTLSQSLSPHLWEDGPAWRVKLPPLVRNGKDRLPDAADPTRRAAFHPVIVNQQVLIADHRSVISYHLTTGKELFRHDLKGARLPDAGPGIDPAPRFSLSVDHERAYVRLGRQAVAPWKETDKDDASYLVCLDLTQPTPPIPPFERGGERPVIPPFERGGERPAIPPFERGGERPAIPPLERGGAGGWKRELWRIKAEAEDKAFACFEGAPLVQDRRVYIALSKIADHQVRTSIVCFDIAGRQLWTREVCVCEELHAEPRYRHHLLTATGGQIVYASHAGAIVAVDAWTGQPAWGVRYASRGPLTAELTPSPRDLAPCIYADGCIYAAPLDTNRLFCIDASTGQVRWELDTIEVVHLLGVAQRRVYATTRAGLMALHTATGQTAWARPTDGRLPSLGRGLLAGSWLFWPTQDPHLPLRGVTLAAGEQERGIDSPGVLAEPDRFDPARLYPLPAGNLAAGEGCLAIAGLDELVVFVPPDKLAPLAGRPQTRLDLLHPRRPDFVRAKLNNP